MSRSDIALLSMACRFPEAETPAALWQNVIEGRRSFRPIPPERLPLQDYDAAQVGEVDSIPPILAGLLTDWTFSRADFHIPKSTFEAADLTHWLALDVAARAIADMGGAEALPRDRTAVIFGDTLTGEFTRSAQLRLRLPYLQRKLAAALEGQDVDGRAAEKVLAAFAKSVGGDFPGPNEETLAGALANTIAGRIANHFDLGGGAWTVDGACASSLLAVADACGRIDAGDVDVAVVGGIDLSLDPFELVGFARAGALARGEMRVFDRRSAGFWPGEGCGVAVLASAKAASRLCADPLSWIRGWGVATDGAGGLTRPTVNGQLLALRRAWARAGAEPSDAGYFEAHGTGTAVGDPTEIAALAELVGQNGARIPVGSIKANIGHCKAAAGFAGLIKVVEAQSRGVVPPHVGCEVPNDVFSETGDRLTPAAAGRLGGNRICGLSGFGFGGVNAHVVLGAARQRKKAAVPAGPRPQDCEIFVFSGDDPGKLIRRLRGLRDRAATMSLGELTDLAASAAEAADPDARFRAVAVAGRAAELGILLERECSRLEDKPEPRGAAPKIGFLFPGQAAPVRGKSGIWALRFPEARSLFSDLPDAAPENGATEVAQPAIVAASLIGLRLMERVGIRAAAAAGHSLGEITALAWAGVIDENRVSALVRERGSIMAAQGAPGGGMALVKRDAAAAATLAREFDLTVACLNGAEETVLAGPGAAVDQLAAAGKAVRLPVSHAFHSLAMAAAAGPFAAALSEITFDAPTARVCSTVTGTWLREDQDFAELLTAQLTEPVRFSEALEALAREVDVLVEVGPGAGLTRLAKATGSPCLSIDSCADSLRPALDTIAELWRRGDSVDVSALYADRPRREFRVKRPRFLANPCGLREDERPPPATPRRPVIAKTRPAPDRVSARPSGKDQDVTNVVLAAVADEVGLPIASVAADARFLDDLHLNSLSVGRIVGAAASSLGMSVPAAVTDLSTVTSNALAAHLTELRELGAPADQVCERRVEGVADWVAEYETVFENVPWPNSASSPVGWRQVGPPADFSGWEVTIAEEGIGGLVVLGAERGAAYGQQVAVELWRASKAAHEAGLKHLAVIHRGAGIEGFARSLLAEKAFSSITLIDVAAQPDDREGIARLLASRQRGFAAWRLAAGGAVQRPVLRRVHSEPSGGEHLAIAARDVALVIGGARGIGGECALRLAKEFGAALALVGRSAPTAPEVEETLGRAKAIGVRAAYRQADATDPEAMEAALKGFADQGLSPTILLHAAGANQPALFEDLSEVELLEALAPKLLGLDAVLNGLERGRLKLVIGFGSIIGALGLAGETHYALPNGMLSERLRCWGKEQGIRTLSLDWSVWAGAGMGERLGAVERLRQQGVDAIPLNSALDRFTRLAGDARTRGRRIVTSRFGPPEFVEFAEPDVPQLRFVEKPRVRFPGVELVVDARLSLGSDPWLEDHKIDGMAIVPGVMLMEAAAQAALALTGHPAAGFEDLTFDRFIAVPPDSATLRIAVLAEEPGKIRAELRASDDDFASVRARMTVLTDKQTGIDDRDRVPVHGDWAAAHLYGPLFFNSGRFQRLESFQRAGAFAVRATLTADDKQDWFGAYQSQSLILPDPGARDAALHALQVAVPQRRVLPVSVGRISILRDADAPQIVEAAEVWSDRDRFCFDIVLRDADGRPVESWKNAEFRAVENRALTGLPDWLLPSAMERAIAGTLAGTGLRVLMEAGPDRASRRRHLLDRMDLGVVFRRADGAPEVLNGSHLSLSHGRGVTCAACADYPVGIDIVVPGSQGAALSAQDTELGTSAARRSDWPEQAAFAAVWAAREALRKAGGQTGSALHLIDDRYTGGLVFGSSGWRINCLRYGQDGCMALAIREETSQPPSPVRRSLVSNSHSYAGP